VEEVGAVAVILYAGLGIDFGTRIAAEMVAPFKDHDRLAEHARDALSHDGAEEAATDHDKLVTRQSCHGRYCSLMCGQARKHVAFHGAASPQSNHLEFTRFSRMTVMR
jgi:hypothetical protein